MRLAFYFVTGFGWNGRTCEEGVGGAEQAVATMAAALARRGHEVTVFTGVSRPSAWRGVAFAPAPRGDEVPGSWDAFLFVTRPPRFHAAVAVLLSLEDDISWAGDYRSPAPADEVWALSSYHARVLVERLGAPASLVRVQPPGIETVPYRQALPKVRDRLLYCSVPVCGAAHLGPVFRRIRAVVPGATLVVTGDMSLWGHADRGLADLAELARLPGVRVLGRVTRRQLIRLQLTAEVHLYPCTCHELLCLAALECQAAGTPTVAWAAGALPETVISGETGLILPVGPATASGQVLLAEAAAGLLRDRTRLARLARRGRERALEQFDADLRARAWEEGLYRLLARKDATPGG